MRTSLLVFVLLLLLALGVQGADKQLSLGKKPLSQAQPVVNLNDQAPAQAQTPDTKVDSKADAEVHWQVIAGGGGMTTVGSLTLGSTIGQSFAGVSTVGTMTLHSGFWQNWDAGPGCCVIRGDVNHSGEVVIDISDLVVMVSYMYQSGAEPVCLLEADIDASGGPIDISDLVWLVSYMYQGGPPPIPCP